MSIQLLGLSQLELWVGVLWLTVQDTSAEGRVEKILGTVVMAVLFRVGVDT